MGFSWIKEIFSAGTTPSRVIDRRRLFGILPGAVVGLFLANRAEAAPGTWKKVTTSSSTDTLSNKTMINQLITTARETVTVAASSSTGTIAYDVVTQSVLLHTTAASGNWTLNVRGNGTTTLGSLLSTGQSLTFAFLNTNGATAYYPTAFQIDGAAVTPKWLGAAPSSGNVNAIDSYTYTVIKTGAGTYTVLASQAKYA